jgi:hypothetical protein
MSLEQDVAAARRAVDAVEQACAPLTRYYGDSVDVRRLRLDVTRLRDDLTLLCGAPVRSTGRPFASAVWGDGDDDGVAQPLRVRP